MDARNILEWRPSLFSERLHILLEEQEDESWEEIISRFC